MDLIKSAKYGIIHILSGDLFWKIEIITVYMNKYQNGSEYIGHLMTVM